MPQERPLQDVFDTVRIPLVGESGMQANGQRFLNGVGFPGQIFYNMVPVSYKNPITGAPETWLENRHAYTTESGCDMTGKVNSTYDLIPLDSLVFTTLTDVMVVAMYDASNDRVYILQVRPSANTVVQIGSFLVTGYAMEGSWQSYKTVMLSELMIAGVPTLGVVLYDDPLRASPQNGAAWYATSASGVFGAGTLTSISDGQFPPNLGTPKKLVGGFVQMNGTTYIMTQDGGIYNSEINSIANWDALGVLQATTYPDKGMGLMRYKHHIVAFGQDTIEFFNDVGTAAPASPLQRTDQAFIKIGAYNTRAMVNVKDTIYWMSQGQQGEVGVYKLDGYTPVKISDHAVDQLFPGSGNTIPIFQVMYTNQCLHLVTNIRKIVPIGINELDDADDDVPPVVDPEGILCINLENNVSWFWGIEQDSMTSITTLDGILTPHELNGPSAKQYVWCMFEGPGATVGGSSQNQLPLITAYNTAQFTAYDTIVTGNTTIGTSTAYKKIQIGFCTNLLDFGNEKRKRVHKLKLIATQYMHQYTDGLSNTALTTFNGDNNKLYFLWSKKDSIWGNSSTGWDGDNVQMRSIDISPTTNYLNGRMYIQNLGSSRTWIFGFAGKVYLPLRVRAIELDISQGF